MSFSTMKLGDFSFGQHCLMVGMAQLNYPFNPEGVCYGVAHMGMQAILADDVSTFNARLLAINALIAIHAISESNIKKLNLLEIPAFMEGVALYNHILYFPELIKEELRETLQSQDSKNTIPLVLSKKLENEGGIVMVCSFSGIYDQEELTFFFKELRESIEEAHPECTKSIALVLSSEDHSITVGYDPMIKSWLFIDPNQLPTKTILDNVAIADEVLSAFTIDKNQDRVATFDTKIYGMKSIEGVLNNIICSCTGKANWKKIHVITQEKAQLANLNNASWLNIAVRDIDYLDTVQQLLDNNANPNQADSDGGTPLILAAQFGHHEIVKQLLIAHADPNKAGQQGVTPLWIAVEDNRIDIIETLLRAHADPNKDDDYGRTPLLIAVDNGNSKAVELLLAADADPNQTCKISGSPLIHAIHRKQIEVIQQLLAAGANPYKKIKGFVSPIQYAKEQRNVEVINILKSAKKKNKHKLGGFFRFFHHPAAEYNKEGVRKERSYGYMRKALN